MGLLGHDGHDRGLNPHANEQQFSLNSPSWPGSEEAWQPQIMLPADTSSTPPVPTTILQRRPKSGEYLRTCEAPHCPPPHPTSSSLSQLPPESSLIQQVELGRDIFQLLVMSILPLSSLSYGGDSSQQGTEFGQVSRLPENNEVIG